MFRTNHQKGATLTSASGTIGREIAFDATHLVSRLNRRALTGIDRIDLLFARRYIDSDLISCGLHYGWRAPHIWPLPRLRALVGRFQAKVGDDGARTDSAGWSDLRNWILGETEKHHLPAELEMRRVDEGARAYLDQCGMRLVHEFRGAIPKGAIYLNVAQSGFEFHRFFEWLDDRPDIVPVFFVHDLLPLDYPEFFRAAYKDRFNRRVETIVRHAKALITTSAVVRDRLAAEYERRGRKPPPIAVQHPPSPLGEGRRPSDEDVALAAEPYFVMVGTVEPRKNHQLILHIWKELGPTAPKLILVGVDGWDHEHVLRLLDRTPALRQTVQRVSGMPRFALRKLVANARALLMPSFAEGFGLPVIEALSLGTPIIASDIDVFREIAGGAAIFLSPIDGLGWRDAIMDFALRDRRFEMPLSKAFKSSNRRRKRPISIRLTNLSPACDQRGGRANASS